MLNFHSVLSYPSQFQPITHVEGLGLENFKQFLAPTHPMQMANNSVIVSTLSAQTTESIASHSNEFATTSISQQTPTNPMFSPQNINANVVQPNIRFNHLLGQVCVSHMNGQISLNIIDIISIIIDIKTPKFVSICPFI